MSNERMLADDDEKGLMLRDHFAGLAMQSYPLFEIRKYWDGRRISESGRAEALAVAEAAYIVADAMLIEREANRPSDDMRLLASAIKKMLPPEKLQELIRDLDPLGSFMAFLRGGDAP